MVVVIPIYFGVFDGIKGSIYDVMDVQNYDKIAIKTSWTNHFAAVTSVTRENPKEWRLLRHSNRLSTDPLGISLFQWCGVGAVVHCGRLR